MRGHMLYAMEDRLTMGKRITKLKEEIRHRREGKWPDPRATTAAMSRLSSGDRDGATVNTAT